MRIAVLLLFVLVASVLCGTGPRTNNSGTSTREVVEHRSDKTSKVEPMDQGFLVDGLPT